MAGPILVTGATGFLGGAVLQKLRDLGLEVIGQGRNPDRCAALRAQGYAMLSWDLSQPLEPAALPQQLSAVIHCAALSAPFGSAAAFQSANVEGTQAILSLAQAKGVKRFVLISSPSIYFDLRDQLDVREDFKPAKPFNHYARTKGLAEQLALKTPSVGPVILRPRGIYGQGDTAILPRVLQAARRGPLPLFRKGQARIDLTHVSDVVAAVVAALGADSRQVGHAFNISGGQALPLTEIIERVCTRAQLNLRWRPMPLRPIMAVARGLEAAYGLLPRQPEPPITRYGLGLFAYAQSLNLEKAKKQLNWQPQVSFDQGLELTFQGADS